MDSAELARLIDQWLRLPKVKACFVLMLRRWGADQVAGQCSLLGALNLTDKYAILACIHGREFPDDAIDPWPKLSEKDKCRQATLTYAEYPAYIASGQYSLLRMGHHRLSDQAWDLRSMTVDVGHDIQGKLRNCTCRTIGKLIANLSVTEAFRDTKLSAVAAYTLDRRTLPPRSGTPASHLPR